MTLLARTLTMALVALAAATPAAAQKPCDPVPLRTEGLSSWSVVQQVDKWGDPAGLAAVSETVEARRPMEFPYHDVTAAVGVTAAGVALVFSTSPNLTGGDTRSGYDTYRLSVRVDGEELSYRAHQEWGSEMLVFASRESAELRSRLSCGKVLDVLLPWHGGSAVFRWELTGSADAIAQALAGPGGLTPHSR